jgi:preprotein translocase subunit SecA
MIFKTNHNILRQAEDTADKIVGSRSKYGSMSLSSLKKEFDAIRIKVHNESKTKNNILDIVLEEVYGIMDATIKIIMGFSLHKVQIMGAILLHHGDLAEMRTGEGKTITATLPAALNSLAGKGVHIVTVNEYLAYRDAEEMNKIYSQLGITVGCVTKDTKHSKKMEYQKDITYITNSELGFDYLRDNMVRAMGAKVQRGFGYAIVDEADSVLIDEARTPLIISGGGTDKREIYMAANAFIKTLDEESFERDAESKTVSLTDKGVEAAEDFFKIQNLYAGENSELNHRIHNALQAHKVFSKEVEYTTRDNKIELIDIFTGRILDGRMYSNGLHQAIQSKEGTEITPESVTHATITYQNLFRLYRKLSGMTGTAKTEEEEFLKIYNMRVFEVPTNKPVIRVDHIDAIYSTKRFK